MVPTRSTTPLSPPRTAFAAVQGRVAHGPRRDELGREVVDGGDVFLHRGRRLADADRLDELGRQPHPDAVGMVRVPDVFGRPVLRHDQDRQLVQLGRNTPEPGLAGEARVREAPSATGRPAWGATIITPSGPVMPLRGPLRMLATYAFCSGRQRVVVVRRRDAVAFEIRDGPAVIVDRRSLLPPLRQAAPRCWAVVTAPDDRHDANHGSRRQ